MGKSLDELISGMVEESPNTSHKPLAKLVKCECGLNIPVPGYYSEVDCKNCRTIEEPSNEVLTSNHYNFQRGDTKVRRKVSRTISAEPYKDHYDKTVDDKT